MASSQSGAVAVVFGIAAAHQISANSAIKAQNHVPVVGTVTLSKFNDNFGMSLDFSSDVVFDEDGVPRISLNHGAIWNVEWEFTPKASSIANAEAELFVATHGATITVSSCKLLAFNVTWKITGMALRFVKAGQATYSIRARCSPEADITTPVT